MQEEFRKLATIRKISEVRPIEGADLIEAVRVDGWWVVCKKGEYIVGSLATYVEIDSWVPTEIASFLSKGKEPKEYKGVRGERLRTVKLKGQLSQGLLLPLFADLEEDADVTEILGITKWEPPAEFRAANAKGNFPFFIRKTDQERLQNIKGNHLESFVGSLLQKTEKLDGSSLTMFSKDGTIGVCSRNLELIRDEENTFWKTAIANGVDNLSEFCKGLEIDIAIQGEMIGPNIQGNKYNLRDHEFYCYDIFDITNQKYLNPQLVESVCRTFGVKHVPIVGYIAFESINKEELLKDAEGKSALNATTEREGFVYKHINGEDSFKCISDKWLLKYE